MRLSILILALALGILRAQVPAADAPKPATSSSEEAEESTVPAPESTEVQNRTSLNLLGTANTEKGESRRNENVQVTMIDNNAARELSYRLGLTATVVSEFLAERGYFGSEMGVNPSNPIHAPSQSGAGIHGNLSWTHNNSVFNARTFFQVGPVQPAHGNQFGANVGLGLWKGAFFNVSLSENKNRGQVNGNVLIPLPEERTPLTTDPALRRIVERIFAAYPNVAPNRPDHADRELNTNSPQLINTDNHSGQLTQKAGDRDTLNLRYAFTAQRVDAFQFIVGQNPNTVNKSHSARTTWHRAWNPQTVMDATIGFDRTGTTVLPAGAAIGPIFTQGLTGLGPPFDAPRWRAQNRYRAGIGLQQIRGQHTLTAGFSLTRLQYNSDEPEVARGVMQFNPDFGRDGITNLRYGTPSRYMQSIGTAYRAYRNWSMRGYFGDHWTVSNRLTFTSALTWDPNTRPHDVSGRGSIPSDSDWNNLGGSAGFAYRLPGQSGVIRSAFGVMFGEIFPVTYGMERYNPPYNSRVIAQAPYLVDPLAGINTNPADPNLRSTRFYISPNLSTPYSYQYNFSWQGEIRRGWRLETGFVGSVMQKLFLNHVHNRALQVPGIPLTTATVSDRRADPRAFEVIDLHNGSRAFYDAGIVTLNAPRVRGLAFNTSYWLSKAIDYGTDYTFTGVGNSSRDVAGQNGIGQRQDQKALSDFDQPHGLLVQAAYDTGRGLGRLGAITKGWTVASVVLVKSGTPFTVNAGSDAPGIGNVDGLQGDRPMLVDPSVLGQIVGSPDKSEDLLPRSAFRFMRAPLETAGSVGRNTFRKGKISNVNASLQRTFVVAGEYQLTFRAESVNFFNTPQFADPGFDLASPNFAQITNTLNDGRTFRFTLRVGF